MSKHTPGPCGQVNSGVPCDILRAGDCVGMTLRDYFAAKALQGFMANKSNPMRFDPVNDAVYAYRIADAMLEARK